MSLTILRKISKNIQNSVYYTIMANEVTGEVTDSSNKKQFAVCLRWVDHDLVTHEELVGLYAIDNLHQKLLSIL